MINFEQQLDFPSLSFDEDRKVLTVSEVASRWRCTDQHVIDLIDEGKLAGFDIAGRHDWIRVSEQAIVKLAERSGLGRNEIMELIANELPKLSNRRSYWRVPVAEGYESFMRENHSLILA